MFLDGTIQNYKFTKVKDELLCSIYGNATSVSVCKLLRTHILAVGSEDGKLELYYMLTGTKVLSSKQATEGPAVITSEDTLDCAITDPCQKISGLHQSEVAFITDLLITAYKDLMVLCIMISSGQLLLYKSFETFKFTRIATSMYLGPCELDINKKCFFIINQGIFISHKFNNL